MAIKVDESSCAAGLKAARGISCLGTKSTITTTMGTGTGSHPRAWTA
jgi:hypothetical protein